MFLQRLLVVVFVFVAVVVFHNHHLCRFQDIEGTTRRIDAFLAPRNLWIVGVDQNQSVGEPHGFHRSGGRSDISRVFGANQNELGFNPKGRMILRLVVVVSVFGHGRRRSNGFLHQGLR